MLARFPRSPPRPISLLFFSFQVLAPLPQWSEEKYLWNFTHGKKQYGLEESASMKTFSKLWWLPWFWLAGYLIQLFPAFPQNYFQPRQPANQRSYPKAQGFVTNIVRHPHCRISTMKVDSAKKDACIRLSIIYKLYILLLPMYTVQNKTFDLVLFRTHSLLLPCHVDGKNGWVRHRNILLLHLFSGSAQERELDTAVFLAVSRTKNVMISSGQSTCFFGSCFFELVYYRFWSPHAVT